MNIEELLDAIDEKLDAAWNLPLTGGRCVVDAEVIRDLIDDIRLNMPSEIKQARQIVADRAEILSTAKREAENVVRRAEERAKALIAEEEVLRQAQARANETLNQAQMKSREMRQAAQAFADNMLKSTEESLGKALTEVKSTRQALRNSTKK